MSGISTIGVNPSSTLQKSLLRTGNITDLQKMISTSNTTTIIDSTSVSSTYLETLSMTEAVTETQYTILVSGTFIKISPASMFGTSNVYFKPTLNLESSVLWKKTLSQRKGTPSISKTGTIISAKLVSGNVNTAVQHTGTVSPIYTSIVGISQTLLPNSVIITRPTRASKDSTTSKSTILVANTSYMTIGTVRESQVTEVTIKTVTPSQPLKGSPPSSAAKGMGKTSRSMIFKPVQPFQELGSVRLNIPVVNIYRCPRT